MLLTFDPRGMTVEVHDDQGALLSSGDSMFDDDDDHHQGSDCDFGGGMDDCPADGEILEIEVDLNNTGVISEASGDAEWEMTNQRVEFNVEIEYVPAGSYTLTVGGDEVGTIQAVLEDDEISGELEFRNPPQSGKLLLDFDPRGKHIDVLQGNEAILEVDFPQ